MLLREAQYAVHADGFNWKYAWFGEHHTLTEYSHLSAPECMIPFVAAKTERIHLGSAIMNMSPPVNHAPRNAERVAMLDHVTNGRYECGHGARRGRTRDADLRPAHVRDQGDVGRGRARDRAHVGDSTTTVRGRVLPGAVPAQHPAQALRRSVTRPCGLGCGNPATFTKAGNLGIGAIAFNFEPIYNLKGRIEAYKEGIAELHRTARGVRQRQRHDDQRGGVPGRRQTGPGDRHVRRAGLPELDGQRCTTRRSPRRRTRSPGPNRPGT